MRVELDHPLARADVVGVVLAVERHFGFGEELEVLGVERAEVVGDRDPVEKQVGPALHACWRGSCGGTGRRGPCPPPGYRCGARAPWPCRQGWSARYGSSRRSIRRRRSGAHGPSISRSSVKPSSLSGMSVTSATPSTIRALSHSATFASSAIEFGLRETGDIRIVIGIPRRGAAGLTDHGGACPRHSSPAIRADSGWCGSRSPTPLRARRPALRRGSARGGREVEDIEHALARLAVERAGAVVAQPVIVETGGLAARQQHFEPGFGQRDRCGG